VNQSEKCYSLKQQSSLVTSPDLMGDNALSVRTKLLSGNVTSAFGEQLWLPVKQQT